MVQSLKSGFHLHLAAVMGVGLLLSFGTPSAAQDTSSDHKTLVATWLAKSCGLGDSVSQDESIRAAGTALVSAFADAFAQGPDEKLLKLADRKAAERFQRRQQVLKSGLITGLSESDLNNARAVDQKTFVARQRSNFVNRYKSQALAGLGIVGGDQGRQILKRIADDPSSPFAAVARTALERLNR